MWGAKRNNVAGTVKYVCLSVRLFVTCTTKLQTICWSKFVDIVTFFLILEIIYLYLYVEKSSWSGLY